MRRIIFVFDERASREAGHLVVKHHFDSSNRAHGVVFDDIPPTICHQDGKVYTSKKALDAAYGNVSSPTRKSDEQSYLEARDSVEKAYYDLRDNRVPRHETPAHVREMWKKVERGEL